MLGLIASGLLVVRLPDIRCLALLVIVIWAFCRAYYFAFYVIERYVDPSFKFAGLLHFARYSILGHSPDISTPGEDQKAQNELPDHLLSFVTDSAGEMVSIHANLSGVDLLIDELSQLRDQLMQNECPHTHLFSFNSDPELTSTMLQGKEAEAVSVCHVKIYGWNAEWAVRHGLLLAKP